MREAVDDLGKALNVLKSAGSHVRLIDMVLNEIVMSEDQRSERHDYDTLSAETKAVLHRINECVDEFSAKMAAFAAAAADARRLHISILPARRPDAMEAIAHMKTTSAMFDAAAKEAVAAVETSARVTGLARDVAQSAARANAELVKVAWRMKDAGSLMEATANVIDIFLATIRKMLRKPI